MPPRKRKIVAIQQDELPRKTRSSAKKLVSNIPQLSEATIPIVEYKNEAFITSSPADNRPTNAKKTKQKRLEMPIKELTDGKDGASSSESDWEEVENLAIEDDIDEKEPVIPKDGIEITLELPEAHKKRKAKKEFDLAAFVRRKVFQFKKEIQENMHKVHLLCLLGYGIRANSTTKVDVVLAVALSLIPNEFLSQPRKKNKQPAQKLVESLMDWYGKKFNLSLEDNKPNIDTGYGIAQILRGFVNGSVTSELVFVTMFLVCVRIIGLDARLIISLQPVPFKLAKAVTTTGKKSKIAIKENGTPESAVNNQQVSDRENLANCIELAKKPCKRNSTNKAKEKSKPKVANKACVENGDALHAGKRNSRRLSQLKISYNEDSESDHQDEAKKDKDPKKCIQHLGHQADAELESKRPKRKIAKKVVADSDEDFKPDLAEIEEFRTTKGFRKNRQALSSDEEDRGTTNNGKSQRNTKIGNDYWIEVYDESAKRWISVDCIHGTVGQVKDLEDNATKPISYVLSFDGKGYIKDVTQRYASNWLSHTRKLRVDADWWLETLSPYKGPSTKRDKLEDEQIEDNLLERPLPTTISEFKNHPLYALKRHLLKFEGIYPPEAAPVGFIRGEPIYARECVKELHSRETWLKEARLVRIGETAYKVVKARPKWIRITGEFQNALPLELFGEWQTEVYVPPRAENGKVPRNDYGNVELFKPSMLPKGTVHLQIPGLNRVSKKLGIDCAPAMIGWDFHGGSSHPVFDGWVVCKEFKATLLEAWDEEQVNIEQREKERREKRVYGNWRRLIRGLLIKEKIRIRYAIDTPMMIDEPQSGTSKESSGSKRKPRKRKNTDG